LNRTKQWKKSISAIVYQPKQFSGINNFLWKSSINNNHGDSLRTIVRNVINGNIPDSLKLPENCLFFINPKHCTWRPKGSLIAVSDNNHHYYL
jgi:hypothetical protein